MEENGLTLYKLMILFLIKKCGFSAEQLTDLGVYSGQRVYDLF